jgi:hypothetical protein
MNQSPSPRQSPLKRLEERQNARGNKLRLLGLFLLFDILLFVAIILSFQTNELVHEEITLEQTREVYDIRITEQVITHTTVITQVMPYGWIE